jgi:hypothetical protein
MKEDPGVTNAFLKLQSIMARMMARPTETKKEALEGIFRLNNEIGKSLRRGPELSPRLVELQLAINAVTTAIKRNDFTSARASFEVAERVMREFSCS